MLSGITLSGGDPFYNSSELLDFLTKLRGELEDVNIWCYTGYTMEELLEDSVKKECIKYLDTIVDGKFIKDLYLPDLEFRGSTNQRIINVKDYIEEK